MPDLPPATFNQHQAIAPCDEAVYHGDAHAHAHVCWCHLLGDSHFDRLVRHATFERLRLLGQLSELQQGHAPRSSPAACSGNLLPPENVITRIGLVSSDGRGKVAPEGTAHASSPREPLHEVREERGNREEPAAEGRRRASPRLGSRCVQSQTRAERAYFERCQRVQQQAQSVDLEAAARSWVARHLAPVVHHNAFDIVFAALIVLNSITIGISIDIAARSPSSPPWEGFELLQQCFNVVFVLEWVTRIIVGGLSFFTPGQDFYWNWLDTTTVLLILVTDWAFALFQVGTVSFGGLRAVKALRLVRVMRVVRVSKLLKFVRALRYLVSAIANTLESLTWAMLLLLLTCFIFATSLTQAATDFRVDFGHTVPEQVLDDLDYWWGDLLSSIYTLFMAIAGGVSWSEPALPLFEIGRLWVGVFLTYIIFTYFAVLNVVTAVFCEKAIKSAHDDHYNLMQTLREQREVINKQLQRAFDKIDTAKAGFLTLQEFERIAQDDEMQFLFESLEINIDDGRDIFRLLDADAGGQLELSELVSGAMRIRGAAKGLDIIRLQHDMGQVKQQVHAIARSIDDLFYDASKAGIASRTVTLTSSDCSSPRPRPEQRAVVIETSRP